MKISRNLIRKSRGLVWLLMACAAVVAAAEKAPEPTWLSGAGSAVRREDPALIRRSGVVRWRNYDAAAFAEAARSNKPVFVFVSANWVARSRAMERLTFGDMVVSTRLNEEFIPVRLNRDEFPDVDLRLQQASRALGGSSGLPLTMVLTPESRPIFGGTFCLAEDDPLTERRGMISIIQRVMQSWKNPVDMLQRAAELDAALQKVNEKENTRGDLEKLRGDGLLNASRQLLVIHALAAAPVQSGGLFPAPRAMELLLAHHAQSGDKQSLKLATGALDAMLRGGIYDQLEGGFYRSTTDPLWIVPHFEKLAGLNAEMAGTCLHVWQKSPSARLQRAIEETLSFWMGMREPGGVFFYGSQAGGNTDYDDGWFATWSVKEIEKVLTDDADCRLAKHFFRIAESGDFPATMPDRNVLYEALSLEEAAKRANIPAAAAEKRLQRIRDILRMSRAERPAPAVDKNIYVDANAKMAAALIECGRGMNHPEWTEQGMKTLRALLQQAIRREAPNIGAAHVLRPDGKALDSVRLQQDEAALFHACVVAFEAAANKEFLAEAEASLKRMDDAFWDKDLGGYFDRAAGAQLPAAGLAWRTKLYQDTSEASPNGLVAVACLKLAAASGRAEFKLKARSVVEAFGGALESLGPYSATLAATTFALLNEAQK